MENLILAVLTKPTFRQKPAGLLKYQIYGYQVSKDALHKQKTFTETKMILLHFIDCNKK